MTIRRLSTAIGAVVALAVTAGGLAAPAAVGSPGSASSSAAAAKGVQKTRFAFTGSGYGTRLRGGAVPAGSSTTSYQAIGCTNAAGLDRRNHVAEVELPGAGTVSGVTTRIWTATSGGTTESVSRDRIANLLLGDETNGSVEISAIESLSRAWHDDKGFHADTSTKIGSIVFTPPGGEPQVLDIPTPDQPIEIPGLLTIHIGKHKTASNADRAAAKADTIKVHMIPSGTKLRVGHTVATIARGVKHGLFGGSSYALKGTGLEELADLGRQPLSLMPCQGTRGEVRDKALAGVDIDDGSIVVEGLASKQRGTNKKTSASGFEEGKVAELSLGNGQLVVQAVVGRANVTREGRQLKANIKGTTFGSIIANGEPQSFPDSDVIEIPGLVKIERNIVKRSANGISVVSLRLTLLDGSGAVIDLGTAKMYIRRSGR